MLDHKTAVFGPTRVCAVEQLSAPGAFPTVNRPKPTSSAARVLCR